MARPDNKTSNEWPRVRPRMVHLSVMIVGFIYPNFLPPLYTQSTAPMARRRRSFSLFVVVAVLFGSLLALPARVGAQSTCAVSGSPDFPCTNQT